MASTTAPGLSQATQTRIEYYPIIKESELIHIHQIDELLQQIQARRYALSGGDAGTIADIFSLTMSLRSRLTHEVSYALNVLTTLSSSMRPAPAEPGIAFLLDHCHEMVDELVEILEEEFERVSVPANSVRFSSSFFPQGLSYREFLNELSEVELNPQRRPGIQPQPSSSSSSSSSYPAPHPESLLILSITNILRNFSMGEENLSCLVSKPELFIILLKCCDLQGYSFRCPLRLSDLLQIRKDVLVILSNVGIKLDLSSFDDKHPTSTTPTPSSTSTSTSTTTAKSIHELLMFFIYDRSEKEPTDNNLKFSTSKNHFKRSPGNSDIAVAALARLALSDDNRIVFGNALSSSSPSSSTSTSFSSSPSFSPSSSSPPSPPLLTSILTLFNLLPLTPSDFQTLSSNDSGLIFIENVSISLFNLIFLAPIGVKRELKGRVGFGRGVCRIVQRLLEGVGGGAGGGGGAGAGAGAGGGGPNTTWNQNVFSVLAERCIDILGLLNDVDDAEEGAMGRGRGRGGYSSSSGRDGLGLGLEVGERVSFFGGAFESGNGGGGDEKEEEAIGGGGGGGGGQIESVRLLGIEGRYLSSTMLNIPADPSILAAIDNLCDPDRNDCMK